MRDIILRSDDHNIVAKIDVAERKIVSRTGLWRTFVDLAQTPPFNRKRASSRAKDKIARLLVDHLSPGALTEVCFADGTVFRFPFTDQYWRRFFYLDNTYEPEIEKFLRDSAEVNYVFLDIGANMGYWSARVSGLELGHHESIAVEPAADTFALLELNSKANGGRFSVLRHAVSDASGQTALLSSGPHAGRSISPAHPHGHGEIVETITIDDIVRESQISPSRPLVVKLDIEGAEVAAWSGAEDVFGRDSIFLYEDHGGDRSHKNTRRALELGRVFFYDGSSYRQIHTPISLDQIKTDFGAGYNFFLTKSDMWSAAISAVKAAS